VTAPYRRASAETILGDHERRIGILEALGTPTIPDCTPVTTSDYAAAVLADTPKLYWQMQDCYDPSGLWVCVDSSGNGLNSDANANAIRQRQPGPLFTSTDRSFGSFYGDSAIASASFNSFLTSSVNNFSIEAWIRPSFAVGVISPISTIWYMGDNSFLSQGWSVELDPTTRKFRYVAAGVGNGAYSTQELISGSWYHIVVKRTSGGTWRYYVNGNLDTLNAGTDTPGVPLTYFIVNFGGVIDNQAHVAYYETALSAGQVSTHFSNMRNS
jgi:hypothetical protein